MAQTVSTTGTPTTARREERFQVAEPRLQVKIHHEVDSTPCVIEATPIDISRNGLKLKCGKPLLFEEPVQLEFCSNQTGLNFSVDGEVRWIRGQGTEWVVGCLIHSPLEEKHIQELSIAGGIDRRRSKRIDSNLPAQAQLPGESCTNEVVVLDVSDYGLRFSSKLRVEVGQRLRLKLVRDEGDTVDILAKAKWMERVNRDYMVGCEVDDRSLAPYQSFLHDQTTAGPSARRRFPLLLTLLAILSVGFFAYALIQGGLLES